MSILCQESSKLETHLIDVCEVALLGSCDCEVNGHKGNPSELHLREEIPCGKTSVSCVQKINKNIKSGEHHVKSEPTTRREEGTKYCTDTL